MTAPLAGSVTRLDTDIFIISGIFETVGDHRGTYSSEHETAHQGSDELFQRETTDAHFNFLYERAV
jgi:hypothetical protein